MTDKIDDPMKAAMKAYFAELGKKGGKTGGKKRWEGISKKKRSEIMKKVAADKKEKNK